MRLAKRMEHLPPYVFAAIAKRAADLRARGIDVIRLDMGSPDLPPPHEIVDALYKSAQNPNNHGYPGFSGTPELRKAMAAYYSRRFGVDLNPETEIVALIGSKEGIANINLAMLDPGDVALVPDPGYPTYTVGASLANGVAHPFSLREDKDWQPDFASIPADVLKKAKLMWLNYPNNPTGAVTTNETLRAAVDFARQHDLLLCYDAPYNDVGFDGYRAPSILSIPGAKDVTLEFNSLSKSHNMAGWRIGMAVGNAEAVSALAQVKSNIDSGIFKGVQDAAVTALMGDQEWMEERNGIYQERRDIILAALRAKGIEVETPKAGLYVWGRVPKGYTAKQFTDKIMDTVGVSITPGTAYGKNGASYFRISLGTATPKIREAMERVRGLSW